MLEGALSGVVGFLALLGAVALLVRLARSVARFALGAAETAAASSLAEASARRGDLTRMSEARQAERAARTGRRRSGLVSLGWALWLVLPLVVGGIAEGWALAAPLWLLPGADLRLRR